MNDLDALSKLLALIARVQKAEAALNLANCWIVNEARFEKSLPDHACSLCVPGGPMVDPDFICALHVALAALETEPDSPEGECSSTEAGRALLATLDPYGSDDEWTHRRISDIRAIEAEAVEKALSVERIAEALVQVMPNGLCPSCQIWFGPDQDPPHLPDVLPRLAAALRAELLKP